MKQIIELIQQLFSAFFPSSKTTNPDNTSDKPPVTNPPVEEKEETVEEEEFTDFSELPQDTVVVTEVLPFDIEPGDIIEDPVEEETTGEEEKKDEEVVVVVPDPPIVTPPQTKNRYMWCLDNGHARNTAGKRSVPFELNGVSVQFFEYEFNRDIVERIMSALTEKGVQFFNVVPELVEDVKLSERVRRANRLESGLPKLYVSVHANAGPTPPGKNWGSANGIETWFYQTSRTGKKVANVFQKYIVDATGWRNRGLKSTELRTLYVLKHTSMPAVLTENGFFNNLTEVKKLMDDEVRQAIADAHVSAILHIEKNGL